ncbi:MAG: peptide-methionine (R)-S-oxide reductase [Limisphaerales bacterium]|jgi:peptide-methionine (R)-S-oxide reductase
MSKFELSEEELLRKLGPERYRVLREAGTERAFTGIYNEHYEEGSYKCGACGEVLFDSSSKFDSHCGWPAFDQSKQDKVKEKLDKSHGMIRREIVCTNCSSHLGHIFDDGPTDSGQRFCVNSASIDFEKEGEDKEDKSE